MGRLDLNIKTEAVICAAQEQALRTNFMKCRIDSNKIRMYGGEMTFYETTLDNARNWLNVNTKDDMAM